MESSPGVFGLPDEDSYSVDFVVDTLNQAYPGCTGVYLSDAGHILAFYGKRGAPNAGLTLEQGMEACMIIQEIPQWMGSLAQVKVQAVSLQEAKGILAGLKCLEKETLKRLQAQLSAMQLGSTLSVTAKPFTPLAASSGTAMAPSTAPNHWLLGISLLGPSTRPMMTGLPPMLQWSLRRNPFIKGAAEVVGGEGDP